MAMSLPPPLLVLFFLIVVVFATSVSPPPPPCSCSCATFNCDSVGIRYGKFCGVGWSGCEGEKPCNDLHACCNDLHACYRDHDHYVDKKGLMSIKCHEKFKNCMRKVKKAGKVGFSKKCPYETGYGNNDSGDGHGDHAQPVGQSQAGTVAASPRLSLVLGIQ